MDFDDDDNINQRFNRGDESGESTDEWEDAVDNYFQCNEVVNEVVRTVGTSIVPYRHPDDVVDDTAEDDNWLSYPQKVFQGAFGLNSATSRSLRKLEAEWLDTKVLYLAKIDLFRRWQVESDKLVSFICSRLYKTLNQDCQTVLLREVFKVLPLIRQSEVVSNGYHTVSDTGFN